MSARSPLTCLSSVTPRVALRFTKSHQNGEFVEHHCCRAVTGTCKFHRLSELFPLHAQSTENEASSDGLCRNGCDVPRPVRVPRARQCAYKTAGGPVRLSHNNAPWQGEMASLGGRGHVSTFNDSIASGGRRQTKHVLPLLHHSAA